MANTELQKRIQGAVEATPPKTKARNIALAAVRWALKCEEGFLLWGKGLGNTFEFVADIDEATIYDGRDSERTKKGYAEAVTGRVFEVVLERVA